jgi:ribose/xylose/arabinose/galactoside ABC-type transport system permease subunit
MNHTAVRDAAGWARRLLWEHLVLALSVAYIVALGPYVPGFATAANQGNVASSLLPLLVLAVGQTFVLVTGGIDLSVTAVIGLASVLGASVMTAEGGVLAGSPLAIPAAVAAMIGVGVAVGLVNGVAVTRLGMPPFLVTLTTLMACGGLAVWYTNWYAHAEAISGLPESFLALVEESRLGVAPYPLAIAAALAIAGHVILRHTLLGRWLFAVGLNRRTAEVSGVPAARVVTAAYVVSGACAAVGSILYTARLETGLPDLGQRLLLDVIAAAVLGGTSLFGGRGGVAGTAAGVLLITLLDNSLNLWNLSNFQILIVKGLVILLAALLDAARRRKEGG